jgi:hypothetical protein
LPNRNSVGFPYSELTKAHPDAGCLAWQTFINKPTHSDHVNKDYTKAKGIILASSLRPIPRSQGNLWKIICLCAFDRSRDPVLVNKILTGERNAYSMGAWTQAFTCSICQAVLGSDNSSCEHINVNAPKMATLVINGKPQLVYLQARNVLGFETSSVDSPAYLSAVSNNIMRWDG